MTKDKFTSGATRSEHGKCPETNPSLETIIIVSMDTHTKLNFHRDTRWMTHTNAFYRPTWTHNAHVPVVHSSHSGTWVDRTEPANTPYLRQLYGNQRNRLYSISMVQITCFLKCCKQGHSSLFVSEYSHLMFRKSISLCMSHTVVTHVANMVYWQALFCQLKFHCEELCT